jgi:hypothetical protein
MRPVATLDDELDPARLGRFYATFWDRFGLVGDMPVIAVSVAGALRWLLASEGEGAEKAFERWPVVGDAFDEPFSTPDG